jgi:hypothetical protein
MMHGKHGPLARAIYLILKVTCLLRMFILYLLHNCLLLTHLISAAAEVLPIERRKVSRHDDIASVQNDIHRSSNGVAVSDFSSDGVGTGRDEIHSRLQILELDLSAALKTLRSRFDKVLSDLVCKRLIPVQFFYCIHFPLPVLQLLAL